MNRFTLSTAVLLGVLTAAPLVSSAQVTPPPAGQRQRMELERRLHLGFQRMVQTQLNLAEGELESLRTVMRSFQEERSELNRAQASLRHRLRDPALPDLTQEEAQGLLREMVLLQERELELYRSEQEELLKVLSPVQLLRFYSLRESMGQRIQQLRQGRGGGRGGGDGPPFSPGSPPGGGVLFR